MPAERPLLEPARRDPFTAYAPPVKVAAKAPPPAPVVIEPSPPPAPPPLNMRFAAQMIDPNGKQVVFATIGEAIVTLEVGQTLSNGYRVRAIAPTHVELEHPPTQTQARFDLPPAPAHQIR